MLAGKMNLRGSLISGQTLMDDIGSVQAGDTLGEESIYETCPRKDSAYAVQDAYMMEFSKEILQTVREELKN